MSFMLLSGVFLHNELSASATLKVWSMESSSVADEFTISGVMPPLRDNANRRVSPSIVGIRMLTTAMSLAIDRREKSGMSSYSGKNQSLWFLEIKGLVVLLGGVEEP